MQTQKGWSKMTFYEMFDAAKAGFMQAEECNLPKQIAMQVTVTDEGEGIFYVEVKDGKLNVQPYNYYDHTAALTLTNKALFALLRREMSLSEMVEAVTGDLASAEQVFAAIPVPTAVKKVTAVKETMEKTIDSVKEVVKKAEEPVKEVIKKIEEPVKEAAKKAAEPVKEVVKKVEEPVKETVKKATEPIKKAGKKAAGKTKKKK